MGNKIFCCCALISIILFCNHQVMSMSLVPALKIGVTIFSNFQSGLKTINDQRGKELVMNSIHNQSKALGELANLFDQRFDIISRHSLSSITIPKLVKFNNAMDELRRYITRINDLYGYYNIYINSIDQFNEDLISYVNKLISHDANDLQSTLELMHELITANQTSTIFEPMINFFNTLNFDTASEKNSIHCGRPISVQQYIFYIFSKLVTAEAKGCIMTAFGYSALTSFYGNKYQLSSSYRMGNSLSRLKNYAQLLYRLTLNASREILACDPLKQIRGETYLELERFAEGVIVNTREMGDWRCEKKCDMPSNNLAVQSQCTGELRNCQELGSRVTVCEPPKNSSKRYMWFKGNSNEQWGRKSSCTGVEKNLEMIKFQKLLVLGSWITGMTPGLIIQPCKYCACTCYQNDEYVIKSFSHVKQLSDFKNNMVVIGVRLVEKQRKIYIQIKQGQLINYGTIQPGTEKWVDLVSSVEIDSRKKKLQDEKKKFKPNENFNSSNSILYLDDLMAPERHAIIGVGFKSSQYVTPTGLKEPLMLSLTTCEFDWMTGQLLKNDSKNQWRLKHVTVKNNPNQSPDYQRPREEIVLDKPDDPLSAPMNHNDHKTNRFVQFKMSDMKKDAGQSTVPFLDAQAVNVQPAFPLGGIGLYYKGAPGYGGFVALKIFTVDVSHFNDEDESQTTIKMKQIK